VITTRSWCTDVGNLLPFPSPACYHLPVPSDKLDDDRRVDLTTDFAGSDSRFVPWRDGYMLPDPFSAKFDGDWLPGTVELELAVGDGDVHCTTIAVHARQGEPLTARGLRDIPLGAFIRMATAITLVPRETTADGRTIINMTPPKYAPLEVSAPRPQRRLSDECLREVATIYKAALATKEPPTRAVEQRHSQGPISYKTAARWVEETRKAGFLPAVEKRQHSTGT
jgi:hypothetical protein